MVSAVASAQHRFHFTQPKMGSPFNLIFYATDTANAAQLAKAAFLLVDSLNNVYSDYIQSSELNLVSNTAGTGKFVPVSPPLYDLLLLSKKASLQSKGAFDITIGPLSKLWRKARKEKTFPSDTDVTTCRRAVDFRNVIIDTTSKKIKLVQPGMQLDLGGIAKGYVAKQVITFLKAKGIVSALADAGGDIVCSNPPPGKTGWTVGINLPQSKTGLLAETIKIHNSAIATSGDLYQYIEHRGKIYSHIIDPRTGYGVQLQRNVTVIARDGATADWLATACSILSLEESKKLAEHQGADLLITQIKGGKVRYYMTRGMKKRLRM